MLFILHYKNVSIVKHIFIQNNGVMVEYTYRRMWQYTPPIYNHRYTQHPANQKRLIQKIETYLSSILDVLPITTQNQKDENFNSTERTPILMQFQAAPTVSQSVSNTISTMMSDQPQMNSARRAILGK